MKRVTISAFVLGVLSLSIPAAVYADTASSTHPLLKDQIKAAIDARASTTRPLPQDKEGLAFPNIPTALGLRIKVASTTNIASTTRKTLLKEIQDQRADIQQQKQDFKDEADQLRAQIQANRDAMKNNIASTTARIKEALSERRQENIKRLSTQMFNRFDAAIDRLTKIADRIDSRLTKISQSGTDVSQYQTLLADARSKIDLAAQAEDTAKASLDALTVSDNPQDTLAQAKEIVKSVQDALDSARQALVNVVKAVIADHPKLGTPTATTTPATTATSTTSNT